MTYEEEFITFRKKIINFLKSLGDKYYIGEIFIFKTLMDEYFVVDPKQSYAKKLESLNINKLIKLADEINNKQKI